MDVQWSLLIFTLLSGMGGWMFVAIALYELRGGQAKTALTAALVAVIAAILGGFASVTHLSHPDRMLAALSHPTSGIFVEAVLVFLVIGFGLVYIIMKKREVATKACAVVALLAALAGIAFSFASGHSYIMAARPAWATITLPLAYMGTIAPAGIAAFMLIAALQDKEAKLAPFGYILAASGGLAALTGLLYGFASNALDLLCIWVGVVGIGGVIPLVCGIASKDATKAAPIVFTALISSVVGATCLRIFMWTVGFASQDFFGLL